MMSEQNSSTNVAFQLQRIYTKGISFETPEIAVTVPTDSSYTPDMHLDLQTTVKLLREDTYEVVLRITVKLTLAEQSVFLCEVNQAGIITTVGITNPKHLGEILNIKCPEMLYPYALECVSSSVIRGGFPPCNIGPINFQSLYANHLQRQQIEQQEQNAISQQDA